MAGKAVVQGTRTWRSEYFVKRLFKEVAEYYIAVMIKTARHYTAIDKHTNLITQGIAESLLITVFGTTAVGPLEHASIFNIDIICYPPTIVTFVPRSWNMPGYKIKNTPVLLVVPSLIPQTQNHYDTLFGSLTGKRHHLTDILLIALLGITFVGMERHLHLVWQGIDNPLCLGQQSPVSGYYRHKALFSCHCYELRKMRMQQRLTHQMKIEELHLPL